MHSHDNDCAGNRRKFISVALGAGSFLALNSRVISRELPVVAYLSTQSPELAAKEIGTFRSSLREIGCIDGRDMTLQWRSKDQKYSIDESISELLLNKPSVFVVSSAGMAALVQAQSNDIPIIASRAGDLEGAGLIQSQKHPGGNITGIEILSPDLMAKRFQIIKSISPNIGKITLVEPITPEAILTSRYIDAIVRAASDCNVSVEERAFHDVSEVRSLYAKMSRSQETAFVISNPLSVRYKREIVSAAAENSVVSIYESRDFVSSGGLISYGPDWSALPRLAATYVVKILNGASPSDLPVQSPTKFELAINLTTANALKLDIPVPILAMADLVVD